jgi:RND family efflux transporter MFP subunit
MPRCYTQALPLAALICTQVWGAEQAQQARAVLKAIDRAVLSGELAARVEKLPLRAGERFHKGDLLVGLDCTLYRAQADKVEAEHQAAELKLENVRQLDRLDSIGALDVSLAQSRRVQTEAELRIARINTARCEIRAPYNGRVAGLLVNRYENIQQQQELIEIVNDSRLEAEIVVPATWRPRLKPGQVFTLRLDDTGIGVPATLATLSPVIDTVSQTLVIWADIKHNDSLMPGMSATAVFTSNGTDPFVTAESSAGKGNLKE